MILPQQIHNAYIIQEDQNHPKKNSLNKRKTIDLQASRRMNKNIQEGGTMQE